MVNVRAIFSYLYFCSIPFWIGTTVQAISAMPVKLVVVNESTDNYVITIDGQPVTRVAPKDKGEAIFNLVGSVYPLKKFASIVDPINRNNLYVRMELDKVRAGALAFSAGISQHPAVSRIGVVIDSDSIDMDLNANERYRALVKVVIEPELTKSTIHIAIVGE